MTETFAAILENRSNRRYNSEDGGEAPILAPTVTISIARTAFEVIAALPTSYAAEGRPDGKGGFVVTLDRHVVERFAAMRRARESYSDVILRLAKG